MAKADGKTSRRRRGATHKARQKAQTGMVDPSLHIVVKDPLRLRILALAIQRPISPSEFAKEASCPLATSSYNFRLLCKHGFLEIAELVQVRGATKHMYRATKNAFLSDQDWGEVAEALRPGVAGVILQDFNTRVVQAMEAGTFYSRDDACMLWMPLVLDEAAWAKLVEMLAWAIDEAKEFEVEAVNRRAKGKTKPCIPVTFAIAGFESPSVKNLKAKRNRKSRGGRRKKGKGK